MPTFAVNTFLYGKRSNQATAGFFNVDSAGVALKTYFAQSVWPVAISPQAKEIGPDQHMITKEEPGYAQGETSIFTVEAVPA